MKFEHDFEINSHLCDSNGILRPGAVMVYLQETANLQINAYGPNGDELRAQHMAFVLSRFHFSLCAPIRAYGTIRGCTWGCPSHGYTFVREHRLFSGNQLLCSATSIWALINTETKTPLRTECYHPGFTMEPLEGTLPLRVHENKLDVKPVGMHTVCYADADQNHHMNNTVYADMLAAYLPMDGKFADEFTINYYHEAPLGSHLTVLLTPYGKDTYYFRTIRDDGETNTESIIHLADI